MGQRSSTCYDITGTDLAKQIQTHNSVSVTSTNKRRGQLDVSLSLPEECLASVFAYLSCQDRNSCSLVCRRWRAVDSKSRNRLVLLAPSEMSPSFPGLLSRFSSVTVLSLKCSRKLVSIDDSAFSCIPEFLPYLRKLKLKGCIDVSDDGLQAFALHCPAHLSKLSFACCGFGARGLNSLLSNCPSLKDLTLKRLRKLDAHNTPLLSLLKATADPDDKNLDPKTKNRIVNEQNKDGCLELERLCVKDLHNARLFGPLLAASCKALNTLIVCRSSGNWDRVLECLQGRTTAISEIQMENVQMGDQGLIAISNSCPDLQVLSLSRTTDCTDDGLSAIANSCKKLRNLHIDAWSRFGSRTIGDEGVLLIANNCPQLQEMVVMGIPITVLSLNALASNCSGLERVALCNSDSVRDDELVLIASKFNALKKLCIKNCPISNSGIEAICNGCPNLVKLKVKRCRGIAKVTLSTLKAQRPRLVISIDEGATQVDGEGPMHQDNEDINGVRPVQPNSVRNSDTQREGTDVLCSSRSANLLRSKFESALQIGRRSTRTR